VVVKTQFFRRSVPYQVSTEASTIANNLILISGPARSGTSLLGNLIASFESIEYSFEPSTLFTLLRLKKKTPLESWKLVYETYLYEDLLLGAVSGRSANFRKKDESSIHNYKEDEEIKRRLEGPGSKSQIQQLSVDRRLAIKLPDVVDVLPSLSKTYPDMSVIIIFREPMTTINSWLSRAWLSDESLTGGLSLIPFRRYKNFRIPHFIPLGREEYFVEISELDRIVYYLNHVYESIILLPKKILLRYEDICDQPNETVLSLSTVLKTVPTKKTYELISKIRPIENLHQNFLESYSCNLDEINSKYGTLVTQSSLQR